MKPPATVLDRYAVGTEGPGDAVGTEGPGDVGGTEGPGDVGGTEGPGDVGGALLRVLDELADEPDDGEGDDDGGIGRELAVG